MTLGYWHLPARVIAKAAILEIYDNTSVPQGVPNPLPTQLFFPFLFSVMGPVSGSYWQGDLTSPAKKVKIGFRYIYHLTISHLSLDRALSRVRHEAVRPLERSQWHVATPRRVPQVTPVRLHSRGPVCSALDAGGGSALPPGTRRHVFSSARNCHV